MSSGVIAALGKAGSAVLNSPKGRKTIGGVVVAALSPFILLVAFLCSLGSATTQHNQAMSDTLFSGGTLPDGAPAEVQEEFNRVSGVFSQIDSQVSALNQSLESGEIDPIQVKASYFALCQSDPSLTAADVVNCYYRTESRTRTVTTTGPDGTEVTSTESYTVYLPNSLTDSYANLSTRLGTPLSADTIQSIQSIYTQVAGQSGEGYDGDFLRGSGHSTTIDTSGFTDPGSKNAHDLAAYAVQAWESGWGYVWGTYGNVLTEDLLAYKLQQYPDGVGQYEDFIRANWLGGRTTDCVGLIKGYGWLDTDSLTIKYGTNGMLDVSANTMYHNATVKGSMDTMPDTPGLAVWMDGHIGVYIGGGEVIEASGTRKGVVKTQLAGRGWSAWLQVPYISYG